MPENIISLLPDSVANQIAAGEVVQRPASAVKELLENSIDAGATYISLTVKDAGKTLIQVVDNGKGMSEIDARMCFERHATSKIKSAHDIFRIKTMGFRGEALASIAAVAQVELKTKSENEDLGFHVKIEGSEFTHSGPCQTSQGTNFQIKNLFFNIPARRNFLKSNQVELKHIIDEFERVALSNPKVEMHLTHNNSTLFSLFSGNLKQRIVGVFGKKYDERLVPINETTDVVKLSGFSLKPEFAKKTRGEQFFFVNSRFIKNHFLHHAVLEAYQDLLSPDQHPGYFLFLDINPEKIDVNIHPTKTEIKFEDEKAIYAILRSAIKHALGQFNVMPTLDFDTDVSFQAPPIKSGQMIRPPQIEVDPNFNPFEREVSKSSSQITPSHGSAFTTSRNKIASPKNWEQIFETTTDTNLFESQNKEDNFEVSQLGNGYLVLNSDSGFRLIHQSRAHERVLFEEFQSTLKSHLIGSQQLLFPVNIAFTPGDFSLIKTCLEDLHHLGFDLEVFGQNQVMIQGIPVNMNESDLNGIFEKIVEQLKVNADVLQEDRLTLLAKTLSKSAAIKFGTPLKKEEMLHLVQQWKNTREPNYSPSGKQIVWGLTLQEISNIFS